jgi:putative ABC transport system permease protein
MTLWSRLRSWVRAVLGRSRMESEMDRELRFHIETFAADLVRGGLSRQEAMRRARMEFGGIERAKEECREARGVTFLESLIQDVRFALGMLRKSPGFTAVAVLTLALGIGANTALFSVVNSVLLKRLPFPDSQRIVVLSGNAGAILGQLAHSSVLPNRTGRVSGDAAEQFTDPLSWRQHVRSFAALAAYQGGSVNLTGAGQPETVRAAQVTPEFFRVFGIEPIRGQDFRADAHGSTGGVLLSWNLWQRRYHADPSIIGRLVVVNARGVPVLGVMPHGFQFPGETEIWVPKGVGDDTIDRGVIFSNLIARIRHSASFAQAKAEMDTITDRVRNGNPLVRKLGGPGIVLMRLQDSLASNTRTPLLLLLGAVGCVLLIACANVANLVFCRGMNRQREVAVRSAMGAGRSRLIRQLLTESLLLALFGGLVGVLLAFWSLRFLAAILPVAVPTVTPITIDTHVLIFTALVSCGTGLLFGLAPALSATKIDLSKSLKDGLAIRGTRAHNRIRGSLLITQIALSFVLLIGAGLMVRTLVALLDVRPGFKADHVLTLTISLPDAAYHSGPQITNYFDQVCARLKALPGVESVGAVNYLPLGQAPYFGLLISTEGHPASSSNPWDNYADFFTVSGNYFQTLHIPLLQGRYFCGQDGPNATRVAIVSESFAHHFWPGQNAVGKQFRSAPASYQVVGVVGNVHHASLEQSEEPEMYLPQQQSPTSTMDVVIRTTHDPANMASAIRDEILTVDKNQPIAAMQTMEAVVNHFLSSQWSHMFLLSIFGLLALSLAAIGCYAVVASSVAQRTHEIGLRMALGAQPFNVLRLVVGHGMRLTFIGVAFGVGGALALTRLMSSLLFGVSATDPLTFVTVSILFLFVALAACYVPVRRAMRVDPMTAIRYE